MGWFSKDDETPPPPEKRIVPLWVKGIHSPLDGWITTSVFIDKEKSKRRIYFAAEKDGDAWQICKYSYFPARPDNGVSPHHVNAYKHDAENAVILIAEIEKMLAEDGYTPVPVLKGNFREAANLIGGYIDDKGNCVLASQTKPVGREATIKLSGLKAMYDAKNDGGKKTIKTWDDYYREVVNAVPGEVTLSEKDKLHSKLPSIMKLIGNALMLMHALGGKELNAEERGSLEKKALSYSGEDLHNLARHLSWGEEDADYDVDGGQLRIVRDYEVARLTTMMRTGAKLYQKLMTSAAVDGDELALLSRINETVGTFAQEYLGLAPALAQQLPNVILQGPDPYADKPLPLEVFYNKCKDQLPPPTPKKSGKPKPPSAG